MQPKVLVTGANGYTGAYFCRYLAERGVPTRGMYYPPDGVPDFTHENLEMVPGDLLDRDSLRRAVDGIEVVQNIAALYRPTNVPEKLYWDVNVDGVRNVLEEASAAGVKRFVQCSTMGVHGTVDHPPGNEDAPIKPDDYYQQTKYEGEVLALERGRELGLWVSVARPAGIYGPRETRFLKLAKLIKSGRFIMFGDGRVTYHFAHVDDLCAGLMLCAERDEARGEAFILGDDQPITLNDAVAAIADALGVPRPRLMLPYFVLYVPAVICEFACKPLGISPPLYRRRAAWFTSTRAFDITKAKTVLGYQPKIRPEDGLKDMVGSFAEAGWLESNGLALEAVARTGTG